MHNRARMLTLALATTVAGVGCKPDTFIISQGTNVQTPTSSGGGGVTPVDTTINLNDVVVTLNSGNRTITVGQNFTVQAAVSVSSKPGTSVNQTVTWSSSNTAVATVSNGFIVGVAPGVAEVCAKAVVNQNKSACITVTVVSTTPTASVTSITVSQPNVSHSMCTAWGNPNPIQYTVNTVGGASSTVTFTSSNQSVVTVNSAGVVNVVGPGTATITITSSFDPTKSAVVTYTVTACPANLTASTNILQLNYCSSGTGTTSLPVYLYNNGVQVNPADVIYTANQGISVNQNGLVTPNATGTTSLIMALRNDPSKTVSVIVSVASNGCIVNPTGINVTTQPPSGLKFGTGCTSSPFSVAAGVLPAAASQGVTWTSQTPGVATVTPSGQVTLTGVGTAVFTVASTANPSILQQVTFQVVSCANTPTDIGTYTISAPNLGCTTTQVQINYSGATSWSSSNNGVATVSSSGLVNAVSAGTVTITGTSSTGQVVTATINVTGTSCGGTGGLTLFISPTTHTGLRGTTVQFQASGTAVQFGIQWFSRDPSRAAVNQATGFTTLVFTGQTQVCNQSKANLNLVACANVIINAANLVAMFDGVLAAPTNEAPKTIVVNVLP